MIKNIFIFYIIGCVLSYAILKLIEILMVKEKGVKPLSGAALLLGVFASWIVVAGAIYQTCVGIKKARKIEIKLAKLSDSEMIKTTIEKYWVPATMYGEEFDPNPILPIKHSPLCKVYYSHSPLVCCILCPIHKADFGCTSLGLHGFHSKYVNSSPGVNRKRTAMVLGRIFEDIYQEIRK